MSKSLAERVKFTITTSAQYERNEDDEIGARRLELTWWSPAPDEPLKECQHYIYVQRGYPSIGDLIEHNWNHFPDLYAHIRTTDSKDFVYRDPYITRDGL